MKSSELSKDPVLKTGERTSVPWVQTPPSPPYHNCFDTVCFNSRIKVIFV